MDEHLDHTCTGGQSRRDLIKRGAAVGGVIWAVPVIESFTSRAAGAVGSPNEAPEPGPGPGVSDIAYVALLISCGGVCTQVKVDNSGSTDCGLPGDVTTPCCSEMAGACSGSTAGCPDGLVTEAVGGDGFQQISLPPGCTLLDYRVHCGQCCDGPGAIGQPDLTNTPGGTFLFNRCSGTGNAQKPCSEAGNEKIPCNEKDEGGPTTTTTTTAPPQTTTTKKPPPTTTTTTPQTTKKKKDKP